MNKRDKKKIKRIEFEYLASLSSPMNHLVVLCREREYKSF